MSGSTRSTPDAPAPCSAAGSLFALEHGGSYSREGSKKGHSIETHRDPQGVYSQGEKKQEQPTMIAAIGYWMILEGILVGLKNRYSNALNQCPPRPASKPMLRVLVMCKTSLTMTY